MVSINGRASSFFYGLCWSLGHLFHITHHFCRNSVTAVRVYQKLVSERIALDETFMVEAESPSGQASVVLGQ